MPPVFGKMAIYVRKPRKLLSEPLAYLESGPDTEMSAVPLIAVASMMVPEMVCFPGVIKMKPFVQV